MSARPYDSVYDPVFTVSGARDHYRQQAQGAGFLLERVAEYSNFFSSAPQYPSSTFRFRTKDQLPSFVDRAFHGADAGPDRRDPSAAVSGNSRFKFFNRPLLAPAAPRIVLDIVKETEPLQSASSEHASYHGSKTRTIGTQSDYRESETQTLPWNPDIVLPQHPSVKQQYLSQKYNSEGPELLQLQGFIFADNKRPVLDDVLKVDNQRIKRAFEASLPPVEDLKRLPLRQKLLEEWERKEWNEREEEIKSIQDVRLEALQQSMYSREAAIQEKHQQTLKDRKTSMMQEHSPKLASIQSSRVKTIRHLLAMRKQKERSYVPQTTSLVQKYSDYGSAVYAPAQREGRFPETKPKGREIETETNQPADLAALDRLERALQSKLTPSKVLDRAPTQPLNYTQRKAAAVLKDVEAVSNMLSTSRATQGVGHGKCWPCPLQDGSNDHRLAKKPVRHAERPTTPVAYQSDVDAAKEAAIVLLQQLIRGRAAQNLMYEGKLHRLELIRELQYNEGAGVRPEDQVQAPTNVWQLVAKVLKEVFLENKSVQPHAADSERVAVDVADGRRQQDSTGSSTTSAAAGGAGAADPTRAASEGGGSGGLQAAADAAIQGRDAEAGGEASSAPDASHEPAAEPRRAPGVPEANTSIDGVVEADKMMADGKEGQSSNFEHVSTNAQAEAKGPSSAAAGCGADDARIGAALAEVGADVSVGVGDCAVGDVVDFSPEAFPEEAGSIHVTHAIAEGGDRAADTDTGSPSAANHMSGEPSVAADECQTGTDTGVAASSAARLVDPPIESSDSAGIDEVTSKNEETEAALHAGASAVEPELDIDRVADTDDIMDKDHGLDINEKLGAADNVQRNDMREVKGPGHLDESIGDAVWDNGRDGEDATQGHEEKGLGPEEGSGDA